MGDSLALSALDWWMEAGVDTLVDDRPRDWLAPPAPRTPEPAPGVAPAAAAPGMPRDLAGFRRWLLTDPSLPGVPAARLDSTGDPAAGTVVVTDMPEPGDRAGGRLLGGEPGALLDRMLAAIALTRGEVYLVPLAPARAPGGRIGADAEPLAAALRAHLALAGPRRLLLLGEAPARALTGLPLEQARGAVRQATLEGATVPAIATYHPRLVGQRPDLRKPAWADLQMFRELA